MKRIFFFIESLEHGGAEKSLISLLKYLDHTKYEIVVSTLKKEGALKSLLSSEVTLKHLNLKPSLFSRLKFKLYKKILSKRHSSQFFWKAVNSDIPNDKNTYDIAIGWGQGFATYYVANKVNANKKVAWINTNYDQAGYIFSHDKSFYKKFNKINGVSPFAVEVMSKHINPQKLIQIIDVIDEEEVKNKSKIECPIKFCVEKFNIISVGRLVKPKAFELSLEAAKILKNKKVNFHWYIVGDGAERIFLENLRKDLSLINEITFVGFDTNPYSFIQQADLYVQTSRFEGLGRTLIEAAILNKPIVTTDFDTAFDLVKSDKTGLITSKEPEAIATAIYSLYTNKDLYLEMIQNLESNSRTSAENVVNQFDALIEELSTTKPKE